jgi:hypothetical protein
MSSFKLGNVDFGKAESMLYFYSSQTNDRLYGSFSLLGRNKLTLTMPLHFYINEMHFDEILDNLADSVYDLKRVGLLKSCSLSKFSELCKFQSTGSVRKDLKIEEFNGFGVVRINDELCCFVSVINIYGERVKSKEFVKHPNGLTSTQVYFE